MTKMADVAKVANVKSKPAADHGRAVTGETTPPSAGDTRTAAPSKKIEAPSGKPENDATTRALGADWAKYQSAGDTKTKC